jgi:hypothetical protein
MAVIYCEEVELNMRFNYIQFVTWKKRHGRLPVPGGVAPCEDQL